MNWAVEKDALIQKSADLTRQKRLPAATDSGATVPSGLPYFWGKNINSELIFKKLIFKKVNTGMRMTSWAEAELDPTEFSTSQT